MKHLQRATAQSMSLGLDSTIQGYVSLLLSIHLHYFSALSEHILPKELSQSFAPIPGGAHGTFNYFFSDRLKPWCSK
jgi:hypothetical protein